MEFSIEGLSHKISGTYKRICFWHDFGDDWVIEYSFNKNQKLFNYTWFKKQKPIMIGFENGIKM